ncbi:helix-turn-helix transcriptional regulator [Agarilytica rhodophyticola]|uniref:helix-turn-helix transcriptional regulator n=1 Tax=Agarilytica rhodophyticola TaxID=1737490 RepID=UPI000B342E5D|nr:PAS domain-containing protein [Agarilytica rhodophyticola]
MSNKSKRKAELQMASSIAEAIAALLRPNAEVVLHDLHTGKIAKIWNKFSDRDIGSNSLLDEDTNEYDESTSFIGPYAKREADGRLLKSVTTILRSPEQQQAIGLLCINLDVSFLENTMGSIQSFLSFDKTQPKELFSNDWREQINYLMHEWLKSKNLSKQAMSKQDKIVLARFLDSKDLFSTRKAPEHFAQLLGVSRATAYNYIAAARES